MTEARVLLVGDEEAFREIVTEDLERAGYRLESAGTVEEARRLLATQAFRVVLLDIRIPAESGLALVEDIHAACPALQVVALAARGALGEVIKALPTTARSSAEHKERPTLAETERRYIRQILEENLGHRQRAAKVLGISERNLYRKLKILDHESSH